MTALLSVLFFALGAIIASFAAVIAERLNTGESWISGRSRCNSCNRTLSYADLVPILSWGVFRGRCRTCRAPVPVAYTLAELALGILFVAAYQLLGLSFAFVLLLFALFVLLIVVLYDLRHTVVPLTLALSFMCICAVYALLVTPSAPELGLTFLVAGAIGLGFFVLHAASGGRWMGLGDAPIALALSLLAGREALTGLLFSFWIGAVIGILILVATPPRHRIGIEVPFVPFLAAGYLLALFTQWNLFVFF